MTLYILKIAKRNYLFQYLLELYISAARIIGCIVEVVSGFRKGSKGLKASMAMQ